MKKLTLFLKAMLYGTVGAIIMLGAAYFMLHIFNLPQTAGNMAITIAIATVVERRSEYFIRIQRNKL